MTERKDQNGGQAEEEPEQVGPPPPKQPVEEESIEATPDEVSNSDEIIETSEPASDARRSNPDADG